MAPRRKKPLVESQRFDQESDSNTYTTQPSPLLSLCPELKNQILHYVCDGTVMRYQRSSGVFRSRGRGYFDGKPEPPGYLLACKQLYYESVKVFYANASFHFQTLLTMRAWLNVVDLSKLDLVKHISLAGKPIDIPEGALVTEKKRRPSFAFGGNRWFGKKVVKFLVPEQ